MSSRRRVGAATVLLVLLSGCGGSETKEGPDRTAAVWEVDSAHPPSIGAASFMAMVRRLACSGGKTGAVHDPKVVEEAGRVVVTFTLDPLPKGDYTCLGGPAVPHLVKLSAPLGDRVLVDGSPLSGGQRWPRR